MTATTITSDTTIDTPEEGTLSSYFWAAVDWTKEAAIKAGSLAYDFFKANPIVTGLATDLLITGGDVTKNLLIAAVETVGGAAGEVVSNAAGGIWDYVFSG